MPRYDDRGAIRKTSYSLFWKIPHSQASPNTIPTSTAMPAQVPGSRRSRAVDVIVSLIVLYTIGSCGVRIWRRNQSDTTAVIPRYATDPLCWEYEMSCRTLVRQPLLNGNKVVFMLK